MLRPYKHIALDIRLGRLASGNDALLFVKDATAGTAAVVINNFISSDTLAVHGYAGLNVTAISGGMVLSLSDGWSVTFTGVSVAAVQQAVKVV